MAAMYEYLVDEVAAGPLLAPFEPIVGDCPVLHLSAHAIGSHFWSIFAL